MKGRGEGVMPREDRRPTSFESVHVQHGAFETADEQLARLAIRSERSKSRLDFIARLGGDGTDDAQAVAAASG